jgi:hypothetical protein
MAQPSPSSFEAEVTLGTTCFSRLFFQFITPVISMARTFEQLQEESVPKHTMNLDTKLLFDTFEAERRSQEQKKTPSIWRALMAGNWTLLTITAVGYLLTQALMLAGPLLLGQIVQGLTCRDTPEKPDCDGTERRLYMCAFLHQVKLIRLWMSCLLLHTVGKKLTHLARHSDCLRHP